MVQIASMRHEDQSKVIFLRKKKKKKKTCRALRSSHLCQEVSLSPLPTFLRTGERYQEADVHV